MSNETITVEYIADYGDWVLYEGKPACVIKCNPAWSDTEGSGTYYFLMFPGGHEKTVYQWASAERIDLVVVTPSQEA